ncbi:hypothetical protein CA267_017125 [Alteromonas pelagimontana]|uniref:TonB-dependent receptor n=1 Tax=Alteromonas pelagimontana TaxID=1858656 RepID=A0A6M4MHE9_9ALTE|nr:hypothetical protein [Alteromonas pelagimontana]QJR82348.1 hypothetical protein CA267_017125 [Alteromonas pelagimontana]
MQFQQDDIDTMLGAYYFSQNLDLDFAIVSLVNLRWQLNIPDYDLTIIAWSQNVLNGNYAVKNGFDAPVKTGKVMAYPGQPGTYGLTVQKNL